MKSQNEKKDIEIKSKESEIILKREEAGRLEAEMIRRRGTYEETRDKVQTLERQLGDHMASSKTQSR